MFEGRSQPGELMVIIVTLLAYGCAVQAIGKRVWAGWAHGGAPFEIEQERASQRVQEAVIQSGKLSLTQGPGWSPVASLVRACAHGVSQVLVCVDGWPAYPKAIVRAFRERVKTTSGKGRCSLQVWPHLLIGQVIKKHHKHRTVEVKRTLSTRERNQLCAPVCMTQEEVRKSTRLSFLWYHFSSCITENASEPFEKSIPKYLFMTH